MNIQDTVKGFQSGCLSLLKIGGRKTSFVFVRALGQSQSACIPAGISLHGCWGAWMGLCTDLLQPIMELPVVPTQTGFCQLLQGFLLPADGKRQCETPAEIRSGKTALCSHQIHTRNSNLITGHAALGSIARRLVVQKTLTLLPHEQA